MTASNAAVPSRKLLVALALSLVLAAATVGRSLVSPADEDPDDYFDSFDFVDDGGAERLLVDTWEPPPDPRDPFLQVDIGFPADADDAIGLDETAP